MAKGPLVQLKLSADGLVEGASSLPTALVNHLWSHAIGITSREHFIFSIFRASPEEFVKVCVPPTVHVTCTHGISMCAHNAQFTRVQRILCLFAVFTTSLAVVALLFGHQAQTVQERVVTTVLAAFLMVPCRVLLPIGFRVANTLPPLSAWPRPGVSFIAHSLVAKRRRLSSRVAQAKVSYASRRHLAAEEPRGRDNRLSLVKQSSEESVEEIRDVSQLDTGSDPAVSRSTFGPMRARAGGECVSRLFCGDLTLQRVVAGLYCSLCSFAHKKHGLSYPFVTRVDSLRNLLVSCCGSHERGQRSSSDGD